MEREYLLKLIQKYIGMTPVDCGCKNWDEMQNKMADEIIELSTTNEFTCDFPNGTDYLECPIWALREEGCNGCEKKYIPKTK